MTIPVQYWRHVGTAEQIVATVERAVVAQVVAPGTRMPTVRALAERLGVAPGTVATAYRTLAARGIVAGRGRQGTHITAGPPLPSRPAPPVPEGVRNLADGNPDPRLLPNLRAPLRRLDLTPVTYGHAQVDDPSLTRRAIAQLRADHVPADRIVVVSGALDGVERILQAHLRPGDRVAVEDPGYARVFDLIAALGLVALPVTIDDKGMQPDALESAISDGATAVILTPRAQNPTGAALDDRRARQLRRTIKAHPDLLVIEDDHAGSVAGAPAHTLATGDRRRWAVVRSVAKSLGPDLRVAVLAGDRSTLDRVEGRLRLGAGWVSQLLQRTVVELWSEPGIDALLGHAEHTYTTRRTALIEALANRGIAASGRSGLNVWVPVTSEQTVVAALVAHGWAVAAGERFRLRSSPAIRITCATLDERDARSIAADLAAIVSQGSATSA